MTDLSYSFPIKAGDDIDARPDNNLWGFGYVGNSSDLETVVVEADTDPRDGLRHQQWAIVDLEGDGFIDMALVNKNEFDLDREARCDKEYNSYFCGHNTSLYIAMDVLPKHQKKINQVLERVYGMSSVVFVNRQSAIIQAAQNRFNDLGKVLEQMRNAFLANTRYHSFDGQVEWIQGDRSENLQLEILLQKGAEQCFSGASNGWNPVLGGVVDGVRYHFTRVLFTSDEVKHICKNIEGHTSYNR